MLTHQHTQPEVMSNKGSEVGQEGRQFNLRQKEVVGPKHGAIQRDRESRIETKGEERLRPGHACEK